jgi:hypothetical protein
VLKPGGKLVVSAPFVYEEHCGDSQYRHDYRRFAVAGLRQLLDDRYDLTEGKGEGGIGTILGGLWLNWLKFELSSLRDPLLPFWLGMSGVTNLLCSLLNRFDSSRVFYSHVFIVGIRRAEPDAEHRRDEPIGK